MPKNHRDANADVSVSALGHKYAQDALYANKDEVLDLWDRGSKAYVCGRYAYIDVRVIILKED